LPKFFDRFYFDAVADKPTAPRNLRVTDSSGESVSLAWDKSASDGGATIDAHVVERRDASRNNWVSVARTSAETTRATATKLWEGCDYYFRVAAENAVGQSDYVELSKAIAAKPPYSQSNSLTYLLSRKNTFGLNTVQAR